MTRLRDRIGALAGRLVGDARLRSEMIWVVATKTAELAILFVLLKLLTNVLGKEGYGEYNLAETALILFGQILLVPVRESYLRDYHGAVERGERRAAGMILVRWYGVATVSVAVVAALLTGWVSERFEFGRWTALAWGLLFLFDRWRFLALDVLNMRRERRAWAIRSIGFQALLVPCVGAALWIGPPTAATALFGYAFASLIFALVVAAPMVAEIVRMPVGRPSHLASMAVTFGVPFGALLLFQWVQGFADRYLLKAMLEPETVGLYVAAFQVCGIPYALMLQIGHSLLVPIAYQRAADPTDGSRLWAADRVMLGGLAVQAVVGALMLFAYAAFGRRLVVLLTNDDFVVPATTLVVLAAGRYVQALSQATQPIFAIHQRMTHMLWLRLFGAVVTLGVCIPMIRSFGTLGAAAGTLVSLTLYLIALWFGPSGCFWLLRAARRPLR